MEIIPALPSRIDEVVVYRSGALVTREATLPDIAVPRVRLVGLPLSLDDASVTAQVAIAERAPQVERPAAIDCKVALERAPEDPGLPPAEDAALREARREEGLARTAREQIEQELARLEELAIGMRPTPKRGDAPQPSPTEARLALIAFRSTEADRLRKELEVRREAHRVAYERLKHREDVAQRASSARSPRDTELRKSILVALAGEGRSGAKLRVSYLVPGARWAPSYVLALDEALRAARIDVRALVHQRTGERWDGVQLTVSTAMPARFTELPELRSIRIGRAVAPRRTGFRSPPIGTQVLFADYDRARPRPASAPPAPPPSHAPPQEVAPYGDEEFTPRHGFDPESFERIPTPADGVLREEATRAAPPRPGAPGPLGGAQPPQQNMASSYGAPIPPFQAAPVAPVAPAGPPLRLQQGMPKRGGIGAMLARSSRSEGAGGAALIELRPPAPAPTELIAETSLLDYGALRLPPAEHPRRGRLVIASRLELYAELTSLIVVDERERARIGEGISERIEAAVRDAEREPMLPAGHSYPQLAAFDHAYRSPVRATVESDGAFHTIPLLSESSPCRPRYVCVPRETADVFRILEIDSPFVVALLPGPIDVYVAGDYRTTATLAATPAKGKIQLGLGVEPAIKVARNARFEEETTGLMRGTLDLRHDVRIDVVSHLATAADVEIRERVPVTQENDEDVKVVIERSDPTPEPYPQEEKPLKGGLAFRFSVAPREKRQVVLVYVIRIPAKHELVGGNRREL